MQVFDWTQALINAYGYRKYFNTVVVMMVVVVCASVCESAHVARGMSAELAMTTGNMVVNYETL